MIAEYTIEGGGNTYIGIDHALLIPQRAGEHVSERPYNGASAPTPDFWKLDVADGPGGAAVCSVSPVGASIGCRSARRVAGVGLGWRIVGGIV